MPPRSFVSSVYCAPPTSSFATSFDRSDWSSSARVHALDLQLAHVRDVEHAGVRPDGAMLRNHAVVLHGHLPPGEGDHSRAERDVALEERRALECLRHHRRC